MIRKLTFAAVAAMALASSPAWAIVDELDAGETKLDVTQDKFAIWIDDATNVGNSVRVGIRPRNSNCVTGDAWKVTLSGRSPVDGAVWDTPTDVSQNPALHNNPNCNDKSHDGWFSADRIDKIEHTVSYTIHGTLKSYDIDVTFSDIRDGSASNVIKLRSH